MQDTQAQRRRPLIQGTPATPKGGIPMDNGNPMDAGIPMGLDSVKGIPMGPTRTYKPKGPQKCTATTKKGDPCKAYARTDSKLCTGHSA